MNKSLQRLIIVITAAIMVLACGVFVNAGDTVQDEVSYRYPVYNTDGDATSGIKEWNPGTVGGTSGLAYTVIDGNNLPTTWGTSGKPVWSQSCTHCMACISC